MIKASYEHGLVGCIGLVKSETWLSKAIRFWMNLYRKKVGKPGLKVYSHSFNIISSNGYLKVTEALAKGITESHFLDAYPKGTWNNILILKPKKPLTLKEKKKFCKISRKYNDHPTRYQFTNFLSQMIWIVFGVWIGEDNKGNDKRFYCTEYSGTVYNELRGYFEYKNRVNPVDLQVSDKFDHVPMQKDLV